MICTKNCCQNKLKARGLSATEQCIVMLLNLYALYKKTLMYVCMYVCMYCASISHMRMYRHFFVSKKALHYSHQIDKHGTVQQHDIIL